MSIKEWCREHIKAELAERTRKENIAKNVYREMVTSPDSGIVKEDITEANNWKKDEAYLYYLNLIDSEDENLFQYEFGMGGFESVAAYKLAHFLADKDEYYEEIVKLLKNNYNSKSNDTQYYVLLKYKNKRLDAGIGQDVTADQLEYLLKHKIYDGLKNVLSDLFQDALSYRDIEFFVTSEVDINKFLSIHKKDLHMNIIILTKSCDWR